MLITRGRTYNEVYGSFEWRLPERYNMALDLCDRHAADPAKVALIHDRPDGTVERYTFRQIQRLANQFANTLQHYGLKPGDRVCLFLARDPATAVAHVGCWKAGMVSLPASILFGADAIEYRLNNSGARVLVTDKTNYSKIQEVRDRLEALDAILLIDGSEADAPNFWDTIARASDRFETRILTPDTPAFLNYTSGTTGWPKGALHGHRCMIGHMPGIEYLLDFFPQPGDLMWSPADWAWIAGLMNVFMCAWFHGVPVMIYNAAGFDPELALHMMAKHRVRTTLLTPTVLKMIRQVPDVRSRFRLDLRSVFTGAEAAGKGLLQAMYEILGININEGYGQTECNLSLGNSWALNEVRPGSLGRALPGHVAQIIDDQGSPLKAGEVGHIAFRRPDPVMLLEYWKNPTATKEKFVDDWMLTGDLGSVDEDGFLWFHGRADDVITSAGYRIGPTEIEDAILRHPAVALAAVIGVPDKERTESIKAFIVLGPGSRPSESLEKEIRDMVRNRLAKHEYPREIEFVEQLPMTTTGKIMRRELREHERRKREAETGARS